MTVTFVSNYINHHQIPLCETLFQVLGADYYFIQTEPMEEERIRMGWGLDPKEVPYLKLFYEEPDTCKQLIAESDVVLYGGLDEECYIVDRLHAGKLVVRLSERLYKEGQWKAVSPRGLVKKYNDHTKYRKKNVYLLCYGGYVASDFHIVRAYPDKMFKWGYFPRAKRFDIEKLLEAKKARREKEDKLSLLWAGRFIDWKHPEYAISAARRLKQDGYKFTLTMVGGGDMEAELKAMVEREGLSGEVHFAGFKKPEEVRAYMEQADIYLFTSDYKEGWGAVLNESMNSGCAVVANCAIGAVPFLIKPGVNGLIYPNKNEGKFYACIKKLFDEQALIGKLGRAAYTTITEEWNAQVAAERLLPLLEDLQNGEIHFRENGVLSKAPVIAPGKMYRHMMKKKNC